MTSSFLERKYIDPWDVENYIYLRKGTTNSRRRSVCFDQAVKYASYQDDGYGPIYGSLVETNLKSSGGDYPVVDDDRGSVNSLYNSLPQLAYDHAHCPSCFKETNNHFSEGRRQSITDGFANQDPPLHTLHTPLPLRNRERRAKRSSSSVSGLSTIRNKIGPNSLGHLRLDYSSNWSKLDRMIGQVF